MDPAAKLELIRRLLQDTDISPPGFSQSWAPLRPSMASRTLHGYSPGPVGSPIKRQETFWPGLSDVNSINIDQMEGRRWIPKPIAVRCDLGSAGYSDMARRFFSDESSPISDSTSADSQYKENIQTAQKPIPTVQNPLPKPKPGLENEMKPLKKSPPRALASFSVSLPPKVMVNIEDPSRGVPCSYCLSTGRGKVMAQSHSKFGCPVLAALNPCKICGASGLDNHTATHCPERQKVHLVLRRRQIKIFTEQDLPTMKVLPKGIYNKPKWTSCLRNSMFPQLE